MRITRIGWAGVRTESPQAMARFCEDVLGLRPDDRERDLWAYRTVEGDKMELFGISYPDREHMSTGPVVGFVVDDLPKAVEELRAAGVALLGVAGPTWQHFRGPDGNVYELTSERNHPAASRRPDELTDLP